MIEIITAWVLIGLIFTALTAIIGALLLLAGVVLWAICWLIAASVALVIRITSK